MKNDEIDNRLRLILVNSLDRAMDFAVESRSIEALGHVATLAAKCIDWETEDELEPIPMGFQPRKEENE